MTANEVSLSIPVVALVLFSLALMIVDDRRHPWLSAWLWRMCVVTGGYSLFAGVLFAYYGPNG